MEENMKYTVSLKQNHVFRRLYAKGKNQVTPHLALYARKNGGKISRLGITTGTKLGHAVVRNRVRRRLREIYRIHEDQFLPGYDIVVVARVRAVHSKFSELERSFLKAARSMGLLKEEKGP
jgi:ribonuclease P protein component